MGSLTLVAILLLLTACTPEVEAPPDQTPDVPTMDPIRAAVRTSLDVRGVRPSPEEIATITADPATLDTLVDGWLRDPRFGDRVQDMWSEVYLTRVDTFEIRPNQVDIEDESTFADSIGQEPLRILGYIAAHDLPYTTLVTGDWTMANETLGAIWPVEYPEGSSGWIKSKYTDDRPAAGVLATNSMWWRYTSTASNSNRKRANAVSRILLCNDYLVRPIEFDLNVNLLDQAAVEDALKSNPACINCHSSLDPLSSYFFGFWWYDYTNPVEASYYFPGRESRWREYSGIAPGYFGEPGYTLSDLGHQIADDHRFPECAVQQAWNLLLRKQVSSVDTSPENQAALARHRDAFLAGGMTLRSLVGSIVRDPAYRSADLDGEGHTPYKMVTADLLASEITGLTGFTYTWTGYDLMHSDTYGFRTLAGGVDGYNVAITARSASTTLVLVQERLAELAAWHVVTNEPSRLFTVDFTETPETDRAAMVAQLQSLYLAIFSRSVAADSAEVTDGLALWAELYAAEGDIRSAWAGTLAALLRDPDLLYY